MYKNILNDIDTYNSLLTIFYGYEEYVFYNKEEYKNCFDFAQKFLIMELDKTNPLYPIINGWKKLISNQYPLLISGIQIYLTNQCNLTCKHCYITNDKLHHMPYNDFVSIVNKCFEVYDKFNLKNEECLSEITLGGGECTLNPNFLNILTYALMKFKDIKILSNCVNIPDDIFNFYKSYKNKITIKTSIDGLEETHNFIRGNDTYRKTISNIKKLIDNDIKVEVQFTANDKNYNEISQVYKELTSIGVDTIVYERYVDQHNKYLKPLSNNQLQEVLKQTNNCKSKRNFGFINDSTSECVVGKQIVIDDCGNLKPCMKFCAGLLNILHSDIDTIVKEIKLNNLKYRVLPQECFNCLDFESCAGGEKCILQNTTNNFYTLDNICTIKQNMNRKNNLHKELYFSLLKDRNDRFFKDINLIQDRFGFFEEQIHPLPEYNETSLHEATSKRIKQLGEKNILWSGGIDSTYLICSYIKENIPFNVVCDDNSVFDNIQFYNWMISKNIPIIKLSDIRQSYRIKNMLSGYLADTIFYFNTNSLNIKNDVSFYTMLEYVPNRDELYENLLQYGKYLNKPTETIYEIARLIDFGIHYIHVNNELNYLIFPNHKITTFFNTKEFNDIGWTQYWDASCEKQDMKYIICDVTNDSSYMNLQKNHCKIRPRKQLHERNYNNFLLELNYN